MKHCLADGSEERKPTVYTSGDWAYVLLEDGTAEIKGCDYSSAKELNVPAEIDGHVVTAVAGFQNSDYLPCGSQIITLPDTVTSVEAGAFLNCEELTAIIVSLEHPTLATIDGVLFYKPDKRLVCYPRAKKDSDYEIPRGIRSIEDYAFDSCSSLMTITLPDTLLSIGEDAFRDCTSLTSVMLLDSVTRIGDHAFSGCTSLKSISLPDTVINIGVNPFRCCSAMTTIIVSPEHPTLATISGVLIDKAEKRLICYPCARSADSYVVPEGVRSLGKFAFSCCRSLTSVVLPDTVVSIENRAFIMCTSLMSITLPVTLTSIEGGAFAECASLRSIAMPERVTSIGAGAFHGCRSLTRIALPDTLAEFDGNPFWGCDALTLTIPRNTWMTKWCKDNGLRYTYADALDWLLE